jgi:hypothetical protein
VGSAAVTAIVGQGPPHHKHPSPHTPAPLADWHETARAIDDVPLHAGAKLISCKDFRKEHATL